jgi:YgiT-type zinc finger domain-containing protein
VKRPDNPCSVCGANLRRETITYTQTLGGKLSIVEDVPASVCPQCGEQYLDPDTVDAIQALVERGPVRETRHVPVYHLPRAPVPLP